MANMRYAVTSGYYSAFSVHCICDSQETAERVRAELQKEVDEKNYGDLWDYDVMELPYVEGDNFLAFVKHYKEQ